MSAGRLRKPAWPIETKLIDGSDQKSADYRAMQPFGQVPIYEEDGLVLFESGAIVMHIAEKSEVLMPRDAAGRAHAISHVFAALNSVEQYIQNLVSDRSVLSRTRNGPSCGVRARKSS